MNNIFYNNTLNKCFKNDGFIIVYDFLNHDEVELLKEVYLNNQPKLNKTFYTSHWINDSHYKKALSNKIHSVIKNKFSDLIKNYKSVFAYFMVKHPDDTSFSQAHQDWSIVDEEKFVGINSWLTLNDVNKNNGAIRILPGSHIKYNQPRGSYIQINTYDNFEVFKTEKFITLNLHAGDLLLFDNRTMHASWNNYTDETRIAVGNILIPENSKITHYYMTESGLQKASLNDDFFFTFSFGEDFITYLKNTYEKNI